MRLNYAIKFVSDMDAAIGFYRDTLGLAPGFQSPFWTEFETGDTRIALHPASGANPAGSVQLGLGSDDVDALCTKLAEAGYEITSPPGDMHGTRIARFRDPDGAEITVSQGR
jgi:predicted enzyme related to lactoylglutathione lyase